MIRINTFSKDGIKKFINTNYPLNKEKSVIVQAYGWEIEEFFSSENKDEWLVVELLGDESGIRNSLSLLSINVMLKYFVEVTVPENYTLEDALRIPKIVKERNMCNDAESILRINIDAKMRPGTIALRLIIPRYTYIDMWSKNVCFNHKRG